MSTASLNARNARVERLRVLSMLMIVAYHYSIWGFYEQELAASGSKLFVDLFGMLGKTGTDLFVLISGYYMTERRFSLKKLLNMMGTVWFYSIGALVCFVLTGGKPGRAELLGAFFPLTSSAYWFVNYYLLLMLFSGSLNRLVHSLKRRELALLCALSVTLVTVLPEFFRVSYAGGSLPLFITLYLCAAYCRIHVRHDAATARRCLGLGLGLLLLCALRITATDLLARRAGDWERLLSSAYFMGAFSPFALAAAVLLLIGCACRPASRGGVCASLGALTFGVYLFHDNRVFAESVWQGLLHTRAYTASPWLPLHAVLSVLGIFAAGTLVEALRQISAGRLWSRLVDAAAPPLERGLNRLWDRCFALGQRLLRDEAQE